MDMGSLPGPGPAAQPAPCYARRGCAHWGKENRIDQEVRDNTQEGGQVETRSREASPKSPAGSSLPYMTREDPDDTKRSKDTQQQHSHHCCGMQNGTAPLEDSVAVLTCDPASTLLGINLNELKT